MSERDSRGPCPDRLCILMGWLTTIYHYIYTANKPNKLDINCRKIIANSLSIKQYESAHFETHNAYGI